MLHRLRQLNRYRSYLRPTDETPYSAREALNEHAESRRLHAQSYLYHGYITPTDIDTDGFITREADPYQDHARYFSVLASDSEGQPQVIAAARLIEASVKDDYATFQTWRDQEITADAAALIQTYKPHECAEVSALVKRPHISTEAVLWLYRALWQYSLTHGHKIWIMSCDARLMRRLSWLFGDAIQPIGAPTFYKGHTVVPAMLRIDTSLDILLRPRRRTILVSGLMTDVARFFLHGLHETALSPEQRRLIRKRNLEMR